VYIQNTTNWNVWLKQGTYIDWMRDILVVY